MFHRSDDEWHDTGHQLEEAILYRSLRSVLSRAAFFRIFSALFPAGRYGFFGPLVPLLLGHFGRGRQASKASHQFCRFVNCGHEIEYTNP